MSGFGALHARRRTASVISASDRAIDAGILLRRSAGTGVALRVMDASFVVDTLDHKLTATLTHFLTHNRVDVVSLVSEGIAIPDSEIEHEA